jgi:hypothetical protein
MNLNTCKQSFCAGAPLTTVTSAVHHRYNSHVYHVELISLYLFLRKNCSRLKTATGHIFSLLVWAVWVECHTEEFCVKVLKFEIMISQKLFNYSSDVVPRTIETAQPVLLSLCGLKMARLKIDRTTLNL